MAVFIAAVFSFGVNGMEGTAHGAYCGAKTLGAMREGAMDPKPVADRATEATFTLVPADIRPAGRSRSFDADASSPPLNGRFKSDRSGKNRDRSGFRLDGSNVRAP